MERQIAQSFFKMLAVTVAVALLGAWQFGFIWKGITYNLYVNLSIFIVMFGGIGIAFVSMYKLQHELVALKALDEAWTDVRQRAERDAQDPYWRHYRCLEKGILYATPNLLGHAYDLVLEQLTRQGRFTLTVETMHTLLHKVDAKLSEERSLLNYISGLLVFLGLLGTFIGLLKMVDSIGAILEGLQSLGGSADGFSKLLTDLQRPLGGMATGFASSLFGLFGSLIVGLLGRLSSQAATVVRNEFESWLAAIGQIELGGGSDTAHAPPQDRAVVRLMADVVSDYGRSVQSMDRVVTVLDKLLQQQEAQASILSATQMQLAAIADAQTRMVSELAGLAGVRDAVEMVGSELRATGELFEDGFRRSTQEMVEAVQTLNDAHIEGTKAIAASNAQMATLVSTAVAGVSRQVVNAPDRASMNDERLLQLVEAAMTGMSGIVQQNRDTLKQQALDSAAFDRRMAEAIADIGHRLADFAGTNSTKEIEKTLGAGLNEMARSMDTAFAAYANLIKHTVHEPTNGQPDAAPLKPETTVRQRAIDTSTFKMALQHRRHAG